MLAGLDANDWTAISTAVAAVAAVIGVCLAARQIKETARISRETVALQTWFELKKEWDSSHMQKQKREAASLLLKGQPEKGRAVADVLDFFETAALLYNRKIVDRHFVWHTLGWWMVPFYAACRDYIRDERKKNNAVDLWFDLENAIPDLQKRNRENQLPTQNDIRTFLEEECDGEKA